MKYQILKFSIKTTAGIMTLLYMIPILCYCLMFSMQFNIIAFLMFFICIVVYFTIVIFLWLYNLIAMKFNGIEFILEEVKDNDCRMNSNTIELSWKKLTPLECERL